MHLLDGFAAIIALDENGQRKKCEYKPPKRDWKANLEGDSAALADNLGNKPDAKSEKALTAADWPSQAHHIIPHKTLKAHDVAKLLKKGDLLYEDANYDVDHEKNGMWLPYASSLPEWKARDATARRELMFKVMRLSGLQLHQGPHSTSKYGASEAGYKQRVREYLDKIQNNAISHYAGTGGMPPCPDCKNKAQAGKYPATDNARMAVDMTSKCLTSDIETRKIFVSKIAAEFAEAGGF